MNIYKIEQDTNTNYDTYDSAVVFAETEEAARLMHPSDYTTYTWNEKAWVDEKGRDDWRQWTAPTYVKVTYVGDGPSTEAKVICSSFNAG